MEWIDEATLPESVRIELDQRREQVIYLAAELQRRETQVSDFRRGIGEAALERMARNVTLWLRCRRVSFVSSDGARSVLFAVRNDAPLVEQILDVLRDGLFNGGA